MAYFFLFNASYKIFFHYLSSYNCNFSIGFFDHAGKAAIAPKRQYTQHYQNN